MPAEAARVHLLRQMVSAVAAAAHDVQLENLERFTLLHFFDSDFLFRTTFGYRAGEIGAFLERSHGATWFQDHRDDEPGGAVASPDAREFRIDEYNALMGALFNASQYVEEIELPPLRAFQPHVVEWSRRVTQRPPPDDPETLRSYLQALNVIEPFEAIAEAGGEEEDPQRYAARFLDELSRVGPDLLIAFDLTAPAPTQRAGYLFGCGLNTETPFDYGPSLVEHHRTELERIERTLRQVRFGAEGVPEHRQRSHATDALCLAMLVRGVAERPQLDGQRAIARFYTETGAIRRAIESDAWLRRRLTYAQDATEDEWPDAVHRVLRDEHYYLMRLLVPDLAFGPRPDTSPIFIDEVIAVAKTVLQIDDPDEMSAVLAGVFSSGGRSLADIIEELSELSFVERVWPQWFDNRRVAEWFGREMGMAGDALVGRVREYQTEHSEDIRTAISERMRVLERDTHRLLGFSTAYISLGALVESAAADLLATMRGGRSLADAMGLLRWSIGAEASVVAATQRLLEDVETTDAAGRPALDTDRLTSMLAAALAGTEFTADIDTAEALGATCLGMLVRAHATTAQAAERLHRSLLARLPEVPERDRDELGRAAVMAAALAAAAGVLAEAEPGRKVREEPMLAALARAEQLLIQTGDVVPGFRASPAGALARSYAQYHAWQALNPSFEVDTPLAELADSRRPELLQRSIQGVASVLATGTTADDDVYEPWLLNHLLYAGAVAGVYVPAPDVPLDDVAERLIGHMRRDRQGTTFSYRFADTLAYHYYLRARRRWLRAGETNDLRPDQRAFIRSEVAQARKWMEEALAATPADPEVVNHRDRIEAFATRIADILAE